MKCRKKEGVFEFLDQQIKTLLADRKNITTFAAQCAWNRKCHDLEDLTRLLLKQAKGLQNELEAAEKTFGSVLGHEYRRLFLAVCNLVTADIKQLRRKQKLLREASDFPFRR